MTQSNKSNNQVYYDEKVSCTTMFKSNCITQSEKYEIQMLLDWYFKDMSRLETLYTIRTSSRRREFISLRLIDFFVVNYCKSKPVSYWILPNGDYKLYVDGDTDPVEGGTLFNVYESYKVNGSFYHKRGFDMFCRQSRSDNSDMFEVMFQSKSNGAVILHTNLRQLRFFVWAIKNHVIDYIQQHKQEIMEDMNATLNNTERPVVRPNEHVTHKKRKLKTCCTVFHAIEEYEHIGFKRNRCT